MTRTKGELKLAGKVRIDCRGEGCHCTVALTLDFRLRGCLMWYLSLSGTDYREKKAVLMQANSSGVAVAWVSVLEKPLELICL